MGSLSGLTVKSNPRAARKPRRAVLIGTGIFDTRLLSVAGYRSRNTNQATDISSTRTRSSTPGHESPSRLRMLHRTHEQPNEAESRIQEFPIPSLYISRWSTEIMALAYTLYRAIVWVKNRNTYHLRDGSVNKKYSGGEGSCFDSP